MKFFFLFSSRSLAARRPPKQVDRYALHLHAPSSAVGARNKFMCIHGEIHYTQLMLWLILYGNFCAPVRALVLVEKSDGKIITTMMWQLSCGNGSENISEKQNSFE